LFLLVSFFFLSFSFGILYLLYRVRLFIFIMRYFFIFFLKCGEVIKSSLGRDMDSSFGGCKEDRVTLCLCVCSREE
jgi:hypothetical protein